MSLVLDIKFLHQIRNSEVAAISSEKKIRVSQSWAKVTPSALPA